MKLKDPAIVRFSDMQKWVGRRCTVHLHEDQVDALITGVLLKLTDDGEVQVKTDDGPKVWAWPALGISEAPRRPRVFFDFRDWWVGYFKGDHFHYVCILPTVVIRWGRHG